MQLRGQLHSSVKAATSLAGAQALVGTRSVAALLFLLLTLLARRVLGATEGVVGVWSAVAGVGCLSAAVVSQSRAWRFRSLVADLCVDGATVLGCGWRAAGAAAVFFSGAGLAVAELLVADGLGGFAVGNVLGAHCFGVVAVVGDKGALGVGVGREGNENHLWKHDGWWILGEEGSVGLRIDVLSCCRIVVLCVGVRGVDAFKNNAADSSSFMFLVGGLTRICIRSYCIWSRILTTSWSFKNTCPLIIFAPCSKPSALQSCTNIDTTTSRITSSCLVLRASLALHCVSLLGANEVFRLRFSDYQSCA